MKIISIPLSLFIYGGWLVDINSQAKVRVYTLYYEFQDQAGSPSQNNNNNSNRTKPQPVLMYISLKL